MQVYKDGEQTVFDGSNTITFHKNKCAMSFAPEVGLKNTIIQNFYWVGVLGWRSKLFGLWAAFKFIVLNG